MGGNSAHCSEILSGLALWGDFYILVFIFFCPVSFEGRGEILGIYSGGGGAGSRVLVRELGGGGGGSHCL